jgi:hypothetical protein
MIYHILTAAPAYRTAGCGEVGLHRGGSSPSALATLKVDGFLGNPRLDLEERLQPRIRLQQPESASQQLNLLPAAFAMLPFPYILSLCIWTMPP